jgi:hypothetical protein
MSVQITEQDFYDMRAQRDNERTKNLALQIELARLTAAHQGESLVVLPRWMVSNMEDKLKAQAALLGRARIALTFYREWCAGIDKTRYPFGDEVENEIRAMLEAK